MELFLPSPFYLFLNVSLLKFYLYGKSEKKIYLEPYPQSYHRSGDCYRQRHRYTELHLVDRYA